MAEYNRTSLINIKTENYETLKGTVSNENSNLVLSPNSACRFTAEYLFSKDNLKTNSFCIRYSVSNSNINTISRYKAKVKVNVHIQYYKEDTSSVVTSYIAGPYSTYQVYPYFINEIDGYINDACIYVDNALIKTLYIDFVNDGENTVNFNGFSIYKEQTATEIVQDALSGISFDKQYKSLDSYTASLGVSGIVAKTTDDKTITLLWKTDEYAENITKFNMSGIYSFYLVEHEGEPPYIWSDN